MLVVRSISSQKGLRLESFCRGARVVLFFVSCTHCFSFIF
jgi:hypothetical protein